jgi:TPR repeat protein
VADVFISYSKFDRVIAESLADDLKAEGFDVWWDFQLYAGDDFHEMIRAEIAKAKAAVVIWSEKSVASRWVRGEAQEADDGNKLISTSAPGFDERKVPINFRALHCEPVLNRARIIAAIRNKGVAARRSANVPPDPLADLRAQVARGEAAAQVELGHKYEWGLDGLAKDQREAVRLYKLAADQGNAQGQSNLGFFYSFGRGGLPKDERKAARLYKLAADQRNAWGQNNLGSLYRRGAGGLPEDEREAARLFKLAADQGNALGQGNLGLFYEGGMGGLLKDEHEAARLYKLAADQGNASGQNNLGAFYATGRGGLPKDQHEAARLFKLAADQDNTYGQYNLADFYERGVGGLPKDEREALRLYKLAADKGYEEAKKALQRVDGRA